MKNVLTSSKIYMLAILLVIAVTASAWQLKAKKQTKDTAATNNEAAAAGDTTRPGKHDAVKDSYGLEGLDESMKQLDIQLKNIDFNFKGLDTTISKAVKEALANIDFKEIGRVTNDAVNSIDWKEIHTEIDKAMQEAHKEIKNIDWEKINTEIKTATDKINSKEFKAELDNMHLDAMIEDAMGHATEGLDFARDETKGWKNLVNQLAKDGLIDKKKGYKVEWNDDSGLYINGKKQNKETTDKYQEYYKKGGFTLKHDGEDTESL